MVVATPTFICAKGDGRQQWICAATSGEVNPLNVTFNCNVWATGSTVTVACPVPGEAIGGISLRPLRTVVRTIGVARATGAYKRAIATNSSKRFINPSLPRRREQAAQIARM
jgi:hypothetical protein